MHFLKWPSDEKKSETYYYFGISFMVFCLFYSILLFLNFIDFSNIHALGLGIILVFFSIWLHFQKVVTDNKRLKIFLFLKKTSILLLIIIILYFFVVFPPAPPYYRFISVNSFNLIQMNNHVKKIYLNEIQPRGREIINSEINNLSSIKNDQSKLDEIFRWEMHDWLNPDWDSHYYYISDIPTYISYDKNFTRSLMAKRDYQSTFLKQTNPNGLFYNDDPVWLAYNKVGACRELSTLFSYMANQAGIKSRTIQTGIWHQWAEVQIDGEWMYYDPWCAVYHNYYNRNDGNLFFRDKWFNQLEYFEENCHPIAIVDSYNEFPFTWATQVYGFSYVNHEIKKVLNIVSPN